MASMKPAGVGIAATCFGALDIAVREPALLTHRIVGDPAHVDQGLDDYAVHEPALGAFATIQHAVAECAVVEFHFLEREVFDKKHLFTVSLK